MMTPQENYDRTENITCPTHNAVLMPATVCPFCRYPEDEVKTPVGIDPFAEADDHPQGMLISDYEDPDYVIGSEFDKPRTFSMEFTLGQVDPDVLGILTGGVLGDKPEPTFALEVNYPIKRTFWQWLRRKPRQWGHVYVPHARLATEEDETDE